MEKEIVKTLDLLQIASDKIHYFVAENIADSWMLQVLAKFIFLGILVLLLNAILKLLIDLAFKYFVSDEKYPVLKAGYTANLTGSLASLLALMFGSISLYSIFWRHKQSYQYLERFIDLIIVLVIAGMAYRVLKAISYYYSYKKDFYRIVAINAISQTLKTIGIFIFTIIAISVVFGIQSSTILGSLGAVTAVLVLVFRDTILGFMTGIHVATSRSLKVGDWIGIPKYNLEGTIEEINIITTKIRNFDKTISTVPTYDLLSTEIRNHQVMAEGNRRRIKRSIIFNINSFVFVHEELFERLKRMHLITDYLEDKSKEISFTTSEGSREQVINGPQLTNIGVFRKYAKQYLHQNPNIDQNEMVIVRQLEITPQGLPLEIYCFATKSSLEDYEDIQADIFDHLLSAAKLFDLEIMQLSRQ